MVFILLIRLIYCFALLLLKHITFIYTNYLSFYDFLWSCKLMNTVFLIYCVKAHLEEGVYLMHKIFTWFTVVISLQRIKRENWIKRETSTFQTRKKYSFDSNEMDWFSCSVFWNKWGFVISLLADKFLILEYPEYIQGTKTTWMQNSCGIKNNFYATVKADHLTLLVHECSARDFQQFHWLLSFFQNLIYCLIISFIWFFFFFPSGLNQILVQVAKSLNWIWN